MSDNHTNEEAQKEAQQEAKKVVVSHETLILVHNPTVPLHKRDDDPLYLLVEYLRGGGQRVTQINLEEAKLWLNDHGRNPRDFSIMPGATIRDWHPA